MRFIRKDDSVVNGAGGDRYYVKGKEYDLTDPMEIAQALGHASGWESVGASEEELERAREDAAKLLGTWRPPPVVDEPSADQADVEVNERLGALSSTLDDAPSGEPPADAGV